MSNKILIMALVVALIIIGVTGTYITQRRGGEEVRKEQGITCIKSLFALVNI